MTAQALFSILVLILAVTVGLSLGFSVKPMVLRAWRAVGGREVDWRDAMLLKLWDVALILAALIVAFAWVARWRFQHLPNLARHRDEARRASRN
jgi:uncharacterized BrkB/YihY/UPF0761 family membrane protein